MLNTCKMKNYNADCHFLFVQQGFSLDDVEK